MKGYIIDCNYLIHVKDYIQIHITPIIEYESGEDE